MAKIENKSQLVKGGFYYLVVNFEPRQFRFEGIATKFHDKNEDAYIFVSTSDNESFIERNLSGRNIFSTMEEAIIFLRGQLRLRLEIFDTVYAEQLRG